MKLVDLGKELDSNLGTIYKCILITGKWGIGKSFYIDEYTKNNYNVYKVSLFGIKDIDDFKFSIAYAINDKEAVLQKKVSENDHSTITFPFLSIPIPKLRKNYEKIIELNTNECNKNILIVDDLERKSSNINMEEVLGTIEELNKIEHLNIVVIANEKEIDESSIECYNRFKEKVIERVYTIDEYTEQALNKICSSMKKKKVEKILKELYVESKNKNLRTLIKTIKFLKQILIHIKIKDLNESNIIRLVKCKLYLMIAINDNTIDKTKVGASLIKKYWNTEVDNKELGALAEIIYNYYISNDEAYCKIMVISFKAKEITEPEKDLFYCSANELIERGERFKNEVMNIYNDKFDINLLEKEISKLDYYLSKAGKNNYFSREEIMNTIRIYTENIDVNSKSIYDYIKIMPDVYDSNFFQEYNEFTNKKIYERFFVQYFNRLNEEIQRGEYNTSCIKNLYDIIKNDELSKFITDKQIKKLIKVDYFLPNINDSLNEEEWGAAHTICQIFEYIPNEKNVKIEFMKVLNKRLEKSTNLGKYRIESLKKQYSL